MLKYTFALLSTLFFWSCQKNENDKFDRFPEGKTKKFITKEGIQLNDTDLELTLFASEPDFANPTNMDIDHKGRVWICEAYNYRNDVNNVPYKKEGDRILILEDTDGDGKSDKTKVFYQGEDINSALGIAILGNKVIVSCSPNVLIFTDTNNDDIPDSKEILFKTKGGYQSDHGLHSFVFGPDGKLYFNFGNFVEELLDKNDQPIKDIYGNVIHNDMHPYQDGMAIRCDIDGKNFEVLGSNFRNNYELAVDSYGRVWQSDNDDDGKRGNRLNYVLPHGNYGYKDEMTGADWRVSRTNIEDSVYLRHWHQNDPGVIPNLHQTYAGSPTGIIFYEGNLLPSRYKETIWLGDAGTNEVNAFVPEKSGAGFKLSTHTVLDAAQKDKWFRPSDVCVSPDGAVYVADWYDTGVGGHFIGDLDRGRVYRVAPKDYKTKKITYDYTKTADCIEALKNPSVSVRYLAFTALEKQGKKAEAALYELFKNKAEPTFQARALWLLAKIDSKYVIEASKNSNEDLRATAARIFSQKPNENKNALLALAADPSPQVKLAVATGIFNSNQVDTWTTLANTYKSGDRWYLEALGIGANGQWDKYLPNYLAQKGTNWLNNQEAKDIVWRSRALQTSTLLAQIIKNTNFQDAQKYYRAFDFQKAEEKNIALLDLLTFVKTQEEKVLIFKLFDQNLISQNRRFKELLPKILNQITNDKDFIEIVAKYGIAEQKPRLTKIMMNSKDKPVIELAANTLTQLFGISPIKDVLNKKPFVTSEVVNFIERIGLVDNETITRQLILIFSNSKYPFKVREAAMLAMEGYHSDVKLWNLIKLNKVSVDLMPAAKIVLAKTFHADLKVEFEQKYRKPKQNIKPLKEGFLAKRGDIEKGKELFSMYCTACHMVGKQGMDFGPALTQIGKKLTKESIYSAIVNPSQGISFGYEGYTINLADGSLMQAIITSQTSEGYMIKQPGQSEVIFYEKAKVKSVEKMTESMMPAFPLQETEFTDLIEYLISLK
ncbi:PVC-type heme-binding CxxCH protein [Lacihabitans lacunae]|uniref:PVC-type heme-binding CxxCH protein n=1 Tax=Lacihabitans lacunae TaxID=1028214 RepID=A0ABV7YV76_9BACT